MAKILVACEESQAVTIELRKLGHEAFSCDLMECSGGHPEWHLQQDVTEVLKRHWDMIIAFPPCTYLTNAATRHYSLRVNPPEKVEARKRKREEGFRFFMMFANADCERIAIENPVGYANLNWRRPDQIIHPYYFGDPYMKRTCLWLKNLPLLDYSKTILEKPEPVYICDGKIKKGKKIHWTEAIGKGCKNQAEVAKIRSKTFPGIAKAMAEQWGAVVK